VKKYTTSALYGRRENINDFRKQNNMEKSNCPMRTNAVLLHDFLNWEEHITNVISPDIFSCR